MIARIFTTERALPLSIKSCVLRGNHVIANRFMKKGELRIPIDSGELIPIEEMDDSYYALQISETHFIGTKEPDFEDATCFLNHACQPNLAFENGEPVLVNLVDIHPGDELTWDYSTSIDDGNFAMTCHCKSDHCRGTITSFGELPEADRRRLLPRALAFIQKRYQN